MLDVSMWNMYINGMYNYVVFLRDICIYDGLYAYVLRVYMNVCVVILDACKCSVNILIVLLDSC